MQDQTAHEDILEGTTSYDPGLSVVNIPFLRHDRQVSNMYGNIIWLKYKST